MGASVYPERDKEAWDMVCAICNDPNATTRDRHLGLRTMVALQKMQGMELLSVLQAANRRREIANDCREIALRAELSD